MRPASGFSYVFGIVVATCNLSLDEATNWGHRIYTILDGAIKERDVTYHQRIIMHGRENDNNVRRRRRILLCVCGGISLRLTIYAEEESMNCLVVNDVGRNLFEQKNKQTDIRRGTAARRSEGSVG